MSDFKLPKIKERASAPARRLYLVRCADASNKKGCADNDRPLTGRGRKSLKKLCKLLKKRGISPDLIVCSPARRGRETLEGVMTVLDKAEIVFLDSLYAGDPLETEEFIRNLPAAKRDIMVIGGRPSLKRLSIDGKKVKKLPKGAMLCVKKQTKPPFREK